MATGDNVLKVGLANLSLSGENHAFAFTRESSEDYFQLTIAPPDDTGRDVSVYRMSGTVAVETQEGGSVHVRVDLTGEAIAGLDRGPLRLSSADPLVGELRKSDDRAAGEDVRYTGDFVAEGTLSYTDSLNSPVNLKGDGHLELSGIQVRGQILDNDHVLVNMRGCAPLLARAEADVDLACVTV
jgi:hypothetical protein